MQLKTALCLVLSTAAVQSASAQDQIIKRNGQTEQVKIKEVGERSIVYKRYDNQNGPDYVITRNEVERIRYENGTEDIIKQDGRTNTNSKASRSSANEPGYRDVSDYGKNIIALSPIAMTNTSATGLSLSYERILDKNNVVSLYLPVTFSFRSQQNINNGYSDRGRANVFWAYPGLKIYPTGSDRKVSYAIGASIPVAFGTESENISVVNNQGIYTSDRRDNNIFLLGGMLTNYLNIQPSPKLFLGLQLGLGIPYVKETDFTPQNYDYRYYSPGSGVPWVEFSFRAGYRF